MQLEKSLYDGGASPQDIAMVISMAAKSGSIHPITPGDINGLKSMVRKEGVNGDVQIAY